jgi:hypothetical protein
VGHTSIQKARFIDPSRQLGTFGDEQGSELVGHLVTAAAGAHRRQLGGLLERDVELAEADQQPQPLGVRLGVLAVPIVAARRRRQLLAACAGGGQGGKRRRAQPTNRR